MMNESFNAARGFVGGATFFPHGVLPRRDVFQCRTRLCGWCSATLIGQTQPIEWFQCRTQHDMWCNVQILVDEGAEMRFQCRTQHDMWCNTSSLFFSRKEVKVSMPHAA